MRRLNRPLYLVYHGDPPGWDEAQLSVSYKCEGADADGEVRPLPPPIYVDLDGEQVDVRYGAVLALLNPTHLPGIDLERSCSWFRPGFVDHRTVRRQAKPHGLPQGATTASELSESLRAAAVKYGHETPLEEYEHLWVTEHRVMAFRRSLDEQSGSTVAARVREFGLIEYDAEERWIELASGSVWNCNE